MGEPVRSKFYDANYGAKLSFVDVAVVVAVLYKFISMSLGNHGWMSACCHANKSLLVFPGIYVP